MLRQRDGRDALLGNDNPSTSSSHTTRSTKRCATHAQGPIRQGGIPILAPEHLLVSKALFDRPKDWLDIEQMLVCVDELDTEEIRGWLARILGADDPRGERFEEMLRDEVGRGR